PQRATPFPYTTLFRSGEVVRVRKNGQYGDAGRQFKGAFDLIGLRAGRDVDRLADQADQEGNFCRRLVGEIKTDHGLEQLGFARSDRKSTRLNSSHVAI